MAKTPKTPAKKKDAKGAKAPAGKSAVAEPGKAKPGQGVHLISKAMLKKLLKDGGKIKEEVDGLVGELREMIGNAKEKHHLHTKAFALLKTFHKLSPEKAADLYDTFQAYMDMAGEMKRIESVDKLPFGDTPPEEEQEQDGKVVTPQFGAHRQAAE